MIGRGVFKGGVSLSHNKNTARCATIKMGVPERVIIPMLQHSGAPCEPLVKKGDTVKVGQVIGRSEKPVSAPMHSGVSGLVKDVYSLPHSNGNLAVEIAPDGKQEIHESVRPPVYSNLQEFIQAIRESGLVGLGGAGFPTSVKLSLPPDKAVDTLLVNAAECEPYITSDYREIMENSESVYSGIKTLLEMLPIKRVLIGVEDDKPEAISLLSQLTAEDGNVDVVKLKSRYPQGAEKMLIYSLTGRKVPPGKLPFDVGVLVMNVSTVSFVAEYLKTGMPLIKKRVTVDGDAVAKPSNVEVIIGTPIKEVFDFCGGLTKPVAKVIMGGPMMGVAQPELEMPVLKHTNALLALSEAAARLPEEKPCIRCGRCVRACPMNLMPFCINQAALREEVDELEKYHTMDCIECGCCSYVCPSKRWLVQSIRLGKELIRQQKLKGGN